MADYIRDIKAESQNWKVHLESKEYYRISAIYVSGYDDKFEIYQALKRIVPTRKWGDGIETYEDFIRPNETETWEMLYASELLWDVRKLLGSFQRSTNSADTPFKYAVDRAKDVLLNHGINFQGMRKTFLFHSRAGHPRQIDGVIRHKIFIKGEESIGSKLYDDGREFFGELFDYSDEYFEISREKIKKELTWTRQYPWRGSLSLSLWYRLDRFEPYTPLWYAVTILDLYENVLVSQMDLLFGSSRTKNFSRSELASTVLSITGNAVTIGQHVEALDKKDIEYEAVKAREGLKNRTNASGNKSTEKRLNNLEHYMCAIESLKGAVGLMSDDRILDAAYENVKAEFLKIFCG